jgi:hypothetical protein
MLCPFAFFMPAGVALPPHIRSSVAPFPPLSSRTNIRIPNAMAARRSALLLPAIFFNPFFIYPKTFYYEQKVTRSKSGRAAYILPCSGGQR